MSLLSTDLMAFALLSTGNKLIDEIWCVVRLNDVTTTVNGLQNSSNQSSESIDSEATIEHNDYCNRVGQKYDK